MNDDSPTEPHDNSNGNGRSGVFRRLMARDLYELQKQVERLEHKSGVTRALPLIGIAVVFLLCWLGTLIYVNQRFAELSDTGAADAKELTARLEAAQRELERLRAQLTEATARYASDVADATVDEDHNPGEPSTGDSRADEPSSDFVAAAATIRDTAAPPLASDQVLLIVKSTESREDAIDKARELEAAGHDSEVILSRSGYYGVSLGRFSFGEAERMRQFVVDSGAESSSSYIMLPDAIRDYIYPARD